jgi:hypothetical protein
LLAEVLNFAGQSPAGRVEAYRGLRMLYRFRRSRWLNSHLNTVASYARDDELNYAAAAVMEEVLTVAPTLDNRVHAAGAFRFLAADLVAIGRAEAAEARLRDAMRWTDSIAPGHSRDRTRAEVRHTLGNVMRLKDPAAALPVLSDVAAEYRRLNVIVLVPIALHDAAGAARASGQRASAKAHLQQALQYIEERQSFFQTPEVRASWMETIEGVFDGLISVELEDQQPAAAFEYLERGRTAAWSARDLAPLQTASARAGIERVATAIPTDMLLIEYALLPDQLAIWTVSHRGYKSHVVAVTRDSVARLIETFDRESSMFRANAEQSRARLYDLLIRPLADELQSIKQLTLIPDRELHRLPFSALWDSRASRYLVEAYQLRTVPSASFFLAAVAGAAQTRAASAALVIGEPATTSASAEGAHQPARSRRRSGGHSHTLSQCTVADALQRRPQPCTQCFAQVLSRPFRWSCRVQQ